MIVDVALHPLRFVREHRFTVAHASALADDTLAPDERRRAEAHAHLCPVCRRLVAELRETIAALGRLRREDHVDDAGVADGVIRRLRVERRRR